jgi:hypothetical protein
MLPSWIQAPPPGIFTKSQRNRRRVKLRAFFSGAAHDKAISTISIRFLHAQISSLRSSNECIAPALAAEQQDFNERKLDMSPTQQLDDDMSENPDRALQGHASLLYTYVEQDYSLDPCAALESLLVETATSCSEDSHLAFEDHERPIAELEAEATCALLRRMIDLYFRDLLDGIFTNRELHVFTDIPEVQLLKARHPDMALWMHDTVGKHLDLIEDCDDDELEKMFDYLPT